MTTHIDEHHYPVIVFYEDTDAAGIVYHANYLRFMERARTTYLREKNITLSNLINQHGVQFLVRAVQLSFERPAKLEQNLTVVSKITKLGRASAYFKQTIFLDPHEQDSLVCSGEIVLVCTNLAGEPCAIPESIVRGLKREN